MSTVGWGRPITASFVRCFFASEEPANPDLSIRLNSAKPVSWEFVLMELKFTSEALTVPVSRRFLITWWVGEKKNRNEANMKSLASGGHFFL